MKSYFRITVLTADYTDEAHIGKCESISGEEVGSYYMRDMVSLEKLNSLQFINMFMYFLAFFSSITMLSAVLMMMNRISNDIEEQMQRIGVLEALGYV